jgi:hypothetical protein
MSCLRGLTVAAAVVAVGAFEAAAASSSVGIPATLDQLVARAGAIIVTETTARRSDWRWSGQGRSIVTTVTFKVERVLKGRAPAQTELVFLGGEIGDVGLRVAGMPEFHVGDRDVLFVAPERRAVSPLVGFSEGRFRIVRDAATGVDQVRMHDGRPFLGPADADSSPAGLARPIRPSFPTPQVVRPLSSAEFQAVVQQKAAERVR